MWWKIPLALGVGTGVGVKLQGANLAEAIAWTALTTGVTSTISSGRAWRAGWNITRFVIPLVVRIAAAVVSDAAIIGRAALGTTTVTTAASIGAGYAIGAVAGTVIVSEAEKREIVYEGATADVIDFYMGEGHYWEQGANDPTPGYFNIPGNASLIGKHYWNKWTG